MEHKPVPVETAALPIPEREEALGMAAALWLAGHSKRAACGEMGGSRSTLSRYMDANGWTKAVAIEEIGGTEMICDGNIVDDITSTDSAPTILCDGTGALQRDNIVSGAFFQ